MGVEPRGGDLEGSRRRAMSKPVDIDPRAERMLSLLAGRPEAAEIVLGGYFALQHYTNYRRTHDVEAWWKSRAVPAAEQAIREAMRQVAAEEGSQTRERRFGDTLSFELVRAGRREFSFQIAVRTIGLEEPTLSPWPPVLIETIADNLASKMNALVDRGAPRDFTDIKHAVDEGLIAVPNAWDLWARKNPGESLDSAKQKALLHLAGLEARRPLEAIRDVAERERTRVTRAWFKEEFLAR